MLILLIRHAQREYREDCQETDQALTVKGEKDSAALGQKLALRLQSENLKVTALLTSSYRRAQQTAAIIAPWLGLAAGQIQPLKALQTEPDGSVEASYAAVIAAAATNQGLAVVGH